MDKRPPWQILAPVFGGLILAGVGGLLDLPRLKGAGFVVAGLGASLALLDSLRVGVIRANWGTVIRDRSPVRFNIEAAFWTLLIAAWLVLSLLYAFGLVGHRPT
jgi:hypothetical protein